MNASEYYSPWAAILLVFVAALTSAGLVTRVKYFERIVAAGAQRISSLDGLRGFLAYFVFVYHAVITREYLVDGTWKEPPNALFAFFGRGCVVMFFMASGYLFWSRAIDHRIKAVSLYISRFWRIMPLYWATMIWVILLAVLSPVAVLHGHLSENIFSLSCWLTGGALGKPNLFGVNTIPLNGGVTWTLQYEWWFYIVLPLLTPLATPRRFILLASAFLLGRVLVRAWLPEFSIPVGTCTGFVFGMAAAHVARIERYRLLFGRTWVGYAGLALLALAIIGHQLTRHYAISGLFGFPLFLAIACGNNLGGLLATRWCVLLGHASYSIYLVHGLILNLVFQLLLPRSVVQSMSPFQFWIAAMPVGVLVIIACTSTYRFIEAPFLKRASLTSARSKKRDVTSSDFAPPVATVKQSATANGICNL